MTDSKEIAKNLLREQREIIDSLQEERDRLHTELQKSTDRAQKLENLLREVDADLRNIIK